jgi:hypothetical protein
MKLKTIGVIGSACILSLAAQTANAQWRTIYQNNFESRTLGTEWSLNARTVSNGEAFTVFNGNYANENIKLNLTPVAEPGRGVGSGLPGAGGPMYRLTFDLYIIDTWDGEEASWGVDKLGVAVNGENLFLESFSNHNLQRQSMRTPDVWGRKLGFSEPWNDSIYRAVSMDFRLPADSTRLTVKWYDLGLQGNGDETWGIDNVNIEYNPIPAPGALALTLAFPLLSRRRRA